jgi:hypothetical protein
MPDKIVLRFGDTDVPAQLNDTETARAFSRHLPVRVHVSGTGVDFCGRMPFSLPYEQGQVHSGWTNGDVNYNPGGGWLAVLYDGEEGSARYGDQVVMGRIAPEDLPRMQGLSGSYDLVIERAEEE